MGIPKGIKDLLKGKFGKKHWSTRKKKKLPSASMIGQKGRKKSETWAQHLEKMKQPSVYLKKKRENLEKRKAIKGSEMYKRSMRESGVRKRKPLKGKRKQ